AGPERRLRWVYPQADQHQSSAGDRCGISYAGESRMRDANRSEESSKGHPMMQVDPIKTARILIVDDQEVNVHFLEGTLRWVAGNTNFKSTTNPREVEALITEFEPDLILLDLHMPERDGFMVMEDLKQTLPAEDRKSTRLNSSHLVISYAVFC